MIRLLPFWLATVVFLMPINGHSENSSSDEQAVRKVLLDYANGWYAGDVKRMASSLHHRLAKRGYTRAANEVRLLKEMDYPVLLQNTSEVKPDEYRDAPKQADIKIFDIYGDAASAKLTMDGWSEYMHLVKTDNQWKVINVFWQAAPKIP